MKFWKIIFAILVFLPFSAAAHTERIDSTSLGLDVEIIEPHIFVSDILFPIWISIINESTGEVVSGLDVKIEIKDSNSAEIFTADATQKGDEYFFEYEFIEAGEYSIHVSFLFEGEGAGSDFKILVEPSQVQKSPFLVFGISSLVLILAAFAIGIKRKKIKGAAIFSVLIIIISILGYSLYVTYQSGAVESGIVSCPDPDTCFWVAHVHGYVPIEICGENFRLPIEVGDLNDPHTHEEKNIIHWHDRLPYDPETQQITDTHDLTLGAFFDEIKVPFDKGIINNSKDGNLCPGGAGTLKMFVNGKANDLFRNYIWRDRDVILLIFDARNVETIEEELQLEPITFPKLGRG